MSYFGAPFQSDPIVPFAAQPIGADVPSLLPASAIGATPFVWGGGGRRLTPDQIARERQMGQSLTAAGTDYSPVQSWTQGLARVADAVAGGLDNRRADKAAEANAAEGQSVVQQLMSAGDPKAEQNTVLSALVNPYIDEKTRSLLGAEYAKFNKPDNLSDFDKQALAGGFVPGTPDWITLHKNHVQEMSDPVVTTPNGQMMLRSQALALATPQPAPPGVTFTPLDGGPTPPASGNFRVP